MRRNAYTLVEMMVVVMIVGIMAGVAIPRFNFDVICRKSVDKEAHKLVGNLRRTRSLALRDAAINSSGYWLILTDPEPYSGYTIRSVETWELVDTVTFDPGVDVTLTGGSAWFKFDNLGTFSNYSNHGISIAGSGKSIAISFIPATGAVKWQED